MESEVSRVVDALPGFVWSASPQGEVDFLNRRWRDYTGLDVGCSRGSGWQAAIHADDLSGLLAGWQSNSADAPVQAEARVRRADGRYRWFLFSARPSAHASGQVLKWCGLSTDIDDQRRAADALREDRKRTDALLAGEKKLLEMVASGRPMPEILAFLCGLVESIARGCYCSIVLVDPDGTKLQEAIAPSLAPEFSNAVRGWPLDRIGGPCVMAARDNIPVVMSDVATDTRWRNGWRTLAQEHGLRSCWSTPIVSLAGQVLGTFALYQREPGTPSPLQLELIAQFTSIASIAIECAQRDSALRLSEARRADAERDLHLTIDTIPALVATYRPDGSRVFVNQIWLDYTGLAPGAAMGADRTALVHPDDEPRVGEEWQTCLAEGIPFESEMRLRRADGTYRWHSVLRVPARDESGAVVKWYSVGVDIEDRKHAETNLAREKHLMEMIAAGRPLRDVLATLCKLVEAAAPDCYCGVLPIDGSGLTFEYGVAPSLPASYAEPIEGLPVGEELLPCGLAAHQKTQVISEDFESDPRWLTSSVRTHALEYGLKSVWSTPICSNEGRVLGTFCVYHRQPAAPSPHHQSLMAHATHIASIAIERSRIEAALRRSEMLLAEGQKLSATGTFSWRVDTDEISFSEELHRIFEFEPDTGVTIEKVLARLHPEDVPALAAQMARVRAGRDYRGYEIRLRFADGRIKHLRTFGRVIRHEDERLECLAAVQDVTQRRIAEETLDRVRSELAHVTRVMSLGALTASIAHEVNQPLAGIITNASTCLRMLAADPPNIDGARETARRTIRDGNRAADVIARLRSLFGKKDTAVETVDLNHATREVLALLFGDLLRNKVLLRLDLADEPLLVTGDRVQLQQVILNLVRNASDAMSSVNDRPRHLLVKATSEDGRARLVVKDVGVGLGPDAFERLFGTFYSTKPEGMGIGLSVSRSIIENHGGEIAAVPNDGPGATFSFSIPRQAANAAADAADTSLTA